MSSELARLLDDTLVAIRRFVVVGDDELDTLALFVGHTWAIEAAEFAPYLWVSSPAKRAGKTTLLGVLSALVREPISAAGISEAALFRLLDEKQITLLLDEIDAIFTEKPSESTEGLRSVLNAGHRRGTPVHRCAGVGAGMFVKAYEVFGAKVLAGIGSHLPDTIQDRSIRIRLERKTERDVVERARGRHIDRACVPVHERWESIDLSGLMGVEPEMPDTLDDRAADLWDSLVAVADLAGGDWPIRARDAAVRLSSGEQREDASIGTALLAGIRQELGDASAIFSTDLIVRLATDTESPFATWTTDGAPERWAPRRLAKLLKEFGVKSKTVRVGGETGKGYHLDDLVEVFARYLPNPSHLQNESQLSPASMRDVTGATDVTDSAGTHGGIR